MSAVVRAALVVEPERFPDDGPEERRHRALTARAKRLERMGERLRGAGIDCGDVTVAFVRDVSGVDDFLLVDATTTVDGLLAEFSPERRDSLAARLIWLGADRSNVLEDLESHRLAGAVEKHRLFLWGDPSRADFGHGLYGLCTVAETIGAEERGTGPFRSGRYCVFGGSKFIGLPDLIAAYLKEYSRRLAKR